jgi:hypothetical protein
MESCRTCCVGGAVRVRQESVAFASKVDCAADVKKNRTGVRLVREMIGRQDHQRSLLRNSFPTTAEGFIESNQVCNHRRVALREIVFGSELLTLRIQYADEV